MRTYSKGNLRLFKKHARTCQLQALWRDSDELYSRFLSDSGESFTTSENSMLGQ